MQAHNKHPFVCVFVSALCSRWYFHLRFNFSVIKGALSGDAKWRCFCWGVHRSTDVPKWYVSIDQNFNISQSSPETHLITFDTVPSFKPSLHIILVTCETSYWAHRKLQHCMRQAQQASLIFCSRCLLHCVKQCASQLIYAATLQRNSSNAHFMLTTCHMTY
jgi:hypothetical protein